MMNTYGTWEVFTEDTEPNSFHRLGYYQGHIDDIAFTFHNPENKILRFKQIDIIPIMDGVKNPNSPSTVDIKIKDYDCKSNKDFFDNVSNTFAFRPGILVESCLCPIFTLRRFESREKKRQKILAKLTDEEKEILGLKGESS